MCLQQNMRVWEHALLEQKAIEGRNIPKLETNENLVDGEKTKKKKKKEKRPR